VTPRPVFASFIDKQSQSRGGVEILEGFPRPVGAVVNPSLVFHRFHQRRHFLWLRWPARTLPLRGRCSPHYAWATIHQIDCSVSYYRDSGT